MFKTMFKYKNVRQFLNNKFDKWYYQSDKFMKNFSKNFSIAFHYFRHNDNQTNPTTERLLYDFLLDLDFQTALELHNNLYRYNLKIHNIAVKLDDSLHPLYSFIQCFAEYFHQEKHEIWADEFYCCDDCDDFYHKDDMQSVSDGQGCVCAECLDNYSYVEDAGTYLHIESDAYNEYMRGDECDESEFEGVWRYDFDTTEKLLKQKLTKEPPIVRDTLVSGLEIEMETRSDCPYDFPQQITDLFNDEYCMFKGDGSLNNGFEMVTAPCTLDYHRNALDTLFNWNGWRDDDGNTYVKAWNTDTCGLHINLNRKSFSQSDIGKILVFINDDMNSSFIEKISGRNGQSYAKRSPKKLTDGGVSSYEKYVAVNLTHSTHIELRIFRGNVTKHGILRCLEFSYALAHYVKRCSIRISSLHYQEFLKWFNNPRIKSQYPYFNEWLVRKDYIKGGNTNRIVTNELNQAIDNVVNG